MRTTTVKRLAVLIAVLGLLGGAGFWTQRDQLKRMAHGVIKQAEVAEQKGDFSKAERLYWEYLEVMPEDLDVRLKYANALLKVATTPKRQDQALQIYSDIVKQAPAREDAHRRLMELEIEMGRFADARTELSILLKRDGNEKDGNLLFQMGQCCEKTGDDLKALSYYEEAIAHNAPQQLEAYQRRAGLLRELGRTQEAEATIEKMVQSAPENYQVFLERGRYRSRFGDLKGSLSDFRQAMKLVPDRPEVYLELAEATEKEATAKGTGRANARRILEEGLKTAPTSVALYEALASLDSRGGSSDKAIETVEVGLKSMPGETRLRSLLALLLAARGDTDKLLLEIRQLENMGYSPLVLRYLRAYYHVNSRQYQLARQLLVPLLAEVGQSPGLKLRVNLLLARCYEQLGDPDMAQDARHRALVANPNDMQARLSYLAGQASQRDFDGAIQGYRELIGQMPQVRTPLVQLLIQKNLSLAVSKRDWSEVDRFVEAMAQDEPKSVGPVIYRARVLLAKDQPAQAEDEIRKALSRSPKNVDLWIALADLMMEQKRVDEALTLMEKASQQIGDRVELRLERAQLWAAKKGPQVITELNRLAENCEAFSKEERHKLLYGLVFHLVRQQDLQGASRLWSRLAEEEPTNIEVRRNLLELAFQTANPADKDQIEKNIRQIEEIEGSEGLLGRYCKVRYLIWQARLEKDEKKQETLRTSARTLLSELKSRRQEWSVIPLALAHLEEQELAQWEKQESAGGRLDEKQKRAKQESIANFYRQAIELGQTDPAVVRHALELLFATGQSSEAMLLFNKIPVASQLAGDLGRYVTQAALKEGDFQRAEELARKAVAANPRNLQDRLWLAKILVARQNYTGAEAELREAVELDKGDPGRWIALVQTIIQMPGLDHARQMEKAEKTVRDAEANLPQPKGFLALAQCCELMGNAFIRANEDDIKEKWYNEARKWYTKAQAAQPDDLLVARLFTDFFLKTGQIKEAESTLELILKGAAGAKNSGLATWAKRKLALTLASGTDPDGVRRALTLLESAHKDGEERDDPEDLRVLVLVLDAQKTPTHHKRAVEILESLVAKNLANPEDRFRLARLLEANDGWPQAREQYRELILRSENAADVETSTRRPTYLLQFANSLLRHHRTQNGDELDEAQKLVDKVKELQPNNLTLLILEVELKRAQNRADEAEKLIQSYVDRPDLTLVGCRALADLAEKLGQLELAERFYRKLSNTPQGKLLLVAFLGRRGHVKDALDLCEPLWNTSDPKLVTAVAVGCLEALFGSNVPPDAAQLERVADWMKQALVKNPRLITLVLGLGNIRERQERYTEAEALYQEAIKQGDRDGVSYNNLAWLMALKDGKGVAAIEYINKAIALQGPRGAHLSDFLDTRGVIYLTAGENQNAIKDLLNAVTADPSPSKYFHLARAYLAANDRDKAKQTLRAAKVKGLAPNGLHPLEQPTYRKVLSELGM
jgi:tetratricopeptide (TPR) repeat protein